MKRVIKQISRLLLCGGLVVTLAGCHKDDSKPETMMEFIDLGLPSGVKWANMNLGANTPEEYGDYYAWGETETKEEYTLGNSKWYKVDYEELKSQGVIDENDNLAAAYDVATAILGDKYSMPTTKEQRELLNECAWEWTLQNGMNGYKVTGPNGNSIFLPAASDRYGSSSGYVGSRGQYWSSTAYRDSYCAYHLYFGTDEYCDWGRDYRYYGQSIRPVMDK